MDQPSGHPDRLYKYRSLAGESRGYTSQIVKDGYIYYASPGELNDPFDSKFSVNMDGAPLTDAALPHPPVYHESGAGNRSQAPRRKRHVMPRPIQ